MGARRRAAHLCLAAADVAVVRLGVDCCLCWKPWLAKAAEGRIVLAVQERRGRASRVRSADGAAMFDAPGYRAAGRLMLSIRSPGVAVNLPCSKHVVVRVPPRDRCQCRPNVESQAAGRPYRYLCCSPLRQSVGLGSFRTLQKEPHDLGWMTDCFDSRSNFDKPLLDGVTLLPSRGPIRSLRMRSRLTSFC
jgi:hypothetical protein